MNLFDILRLASERAAETGDDMRTDYHSAIGLCAYILSGGKPPLPLSESDVSSMEKLCGASGERERALRAVQVAQLTFAAILAEATGGNGK